MSQHQTWKSLPKNIFRTIKESQFKWAIQDTGATFGHLPPAPLCEQSQQHIGLYLMAHLDVAETIPTEALKLCVDGNLGNFLYEIPGIPR